MELMRGGEVCRLLGLPATMLSKWIKAGYLAPVMQGRCKGEHHTFAVVPDVLCLAIGRELRLAGVSLTAVGSAMNALAALGAKEIEAAIAQGRTHLLIVRESACPQLLHPAAIFSNPQIDIEAAQRLGVLVAAVDVGGCLARLRSHLTPKTKIDRKSAAAGVKKEKEPVAQ